MNAIKTLTAAAILLAGSLPVAHAGHGHFAAAAPVQRHATDRSHGRYDRYRYTDRHYRTQRHYPRYRYRPNAAYVYRPLVAPVVYPRYHRYDRHRFGPFRHHYRYRGDGIRIGPHGLTIFLGFDD